MKNKFGVLNQVMLTEDLIDVKCELGELTMMGVRIHPVFGGDTLQIQHPKKLKDGRLSYNPIAEWKRDKYNDYHLKFIEDKPLFADKDDFWYLVELGYKRLKAEQY